MPNRTLLLLTMAMTVGSSAAAEPAITLLHELPVRVYDAADLSPEAKAAALAVAAGTLAHAPVDIVWIRCDSGADARRCGSLPGPAEMIVRFVRSPGSGSAARGRADLRARLPLGDAFVDAASASGVLATIYVDRVAALAAAAHVDVRPVLGRAVGHELAHLLLGSGEHNGRGLMRAVWKPEDLRRDGDADWMLTPGEAAAIGRRLEAARALARHGLPAGPGR